MSNNTRVTRASKLFSEFLVIVVGVLVALAVDEFMTSREAVTRVDGYLFEVEGELTDMLARVRDERQRLELAFSQGEALYEGIGAKPLASTDSLDTWFGAQLRNAAYDFPLGTLGALIASGDLLLIEDPELRAILSATAEAVDRAGMSNALGDEFFANAFFRLGEEVDLLALAPSARAGAWDWVEISNNTRARSALYVLVGVSRNHTAAAQDLEEALTIGLDAIQAR